MVTFVRMSEAQFAVFSVSTISEYARNRMLCGDWPIDKEKLKAHSLFSKLLCNGLDTPGHYCRILVAPELKKNIGVFWFAVNPIEKAAFIYEIDIYPEFRRLGYAKQAIQHLEGMAFELGFSQIRLNVFSHNHQAQALYRTLDFLPTSMEMVKSL